MDNWGYYGHYADRVFILFLNKLHESESQQGMYSIARECS